MAEKSVPSNVMPDAWGRTAAKGVFENDGLSSNGLALANVTHLEGCVRFRWAQIKRIF